MITELIFSTVTEIPFKLGEGSINRWWQYRKRLQLQVMITYSSLNEHNTWGFHYNHFENIGIYLEVPLKLHVQNRSSVPRTLNFVSLHLRKDDREIAKLIPIEKQEIMTVRVNEDGIKETFLKPESVYGEKGSYSLNVPADESIEKPLLFLLEKGDLKSGPTDFNSIWLSYEDENSKMHWFRIADVDGSWHIGNFSLPLHWIRLKEEKKHS